MNGYEEKIKDCLFLEVCNAAGREEWDGLAHQQKENLMLVCRLSGYDEKFQRDCGLVTREQMEHWGIEEEVLFQDAWANMFAKRPPVLMDFEDAYGHHYDQNILAMEKKPDMKFNTMNLDESKQVAEMYYSYDGETIGYIINMPYRDSSWGVDFEDSIEKEYSKSVNNCEIKITLYKLKDNEKSGCVAKFKYGSIEYLLTGTMKQQEFEKILKNLVFPK